MHKGAKCLDVSTDRVYISCDVVFDETMFPFVDLHPNVGALLRHEILLLHSHLTGFDQRGDNNCVDPSLTNPHNRVHELYGNATEEIDGEIGEEIARNDQEISPNEQYLMCPGLGSKSSLGSALQDLPRPSTLESMQLHGTSASETASPARRGSGVSPGDTRSIVTHQSGDIEPRQSKAATRLPERR